MVGGYVADYGTDACQQIKEWHCVAAVDCTVTLAISTLSGFLLCTYGSLRGTFVTRIGGVLNRLIAYIVLENERWKYLLRR
jgi:hypothetical protein